MHSSPWARLAQSHRVLYPVAMRTDPADRQRTILLVEDEAVIAITEKRQLEVGGYRVVTAEDGESAVMRATGDPTIDLVLMDIDLGPGIPGTEAAREILMQRELPIVFLSSHSEQEVVQTVKGITRYGYVLKTAGRFVLLEQVSTAFELFDAHQQLVESERRYQFIAGNTSDAVLVYEHGSFTYASPSVKHLLGYPAVDYYHETFDSLLEWIHPADRAGAQEALNRIVSTQEAKTRLTFRVLRDDNTYRTLETDLSCTFTGDGTLDLMIASFRDITERSQRERIMQVDLLGATTRLQTIADNLPGMVYEFKVAADGQWSWPYVSRGARDYYGLDPEAIQLDFRVLADAVHPLDRARTEALVESSRRTLHPYEITHRIVRPDGVIRWITARSIPRRMPDGSTVWTGVSVDVTAQVEAESRILEQQRRLQAVFTAAGVGIVETSAEGVILQVNRQFADLIGLPENALRDTAIEVISNPEDYQWEWEKLSSFPPDAAPAQLEYQKRFLRHGGGEQWVHVHAARISATAEPTRYVFVVREVQDYRRAGAVAPPSLGEREPEHYLKAELYRLVQEDPAIFDFLQAGSLDGIWYWDLEHPEHEWMSPRFWETLGYDPATKRHDPAEWQDLIHPEDLQLTMENYASHLADPAHPFDQIIRYRHRNGSTVWIRSRGIAVRDQDGNAVRMLGAHNEITQAKETEIQLREALDAKAQLMQELHHRVKNNLAMVHGLLSAKDTSLGDTVDLSDTIAQVNAILTAHRLLAVDGEQNEVDLPSYFYDLLQTLFSGTRSEPTQWTLEVPELRVASGPAVTLGLVMNELALNAEKHAFQDERWFECRATESSDSVEFRVSNGGRELPPGFSIAGNAGLGLQLVRGMIRQLKGSITFHRNPTTFVITVPSASLTKT